MQQTWWNAGKSSGGTSGAWAKLAPVVPARRTRLCSGCRTARLSGAGRRV